MAGRICAGIGQLILAVAGFIMFTGWFIQMCLDTYRSLKGIDAEPLPFPWLGRAGALTFLATWLWSLITSFSVLREGQRNEKTKLT